MRKSVRLTNANRADEWAKCAQRHELARQVKPGKSKGSTGEDQKECEELFRDMLNKEGITYSGDLRAKPQNQADIHTHDKRGEWVNIEVKHGAGPLAYAWTFNLEAITERTRDIALPDADWVIYHRHANPQAGRRVMLKEYRVSSREDFLDMLEEYAHGPRAQGFFTSTKLSKGGKQMDIQTTYLDRFWEGMKDDPRTMSAWEFCYTVLGRKPRMK